MRLLAGRIASPCMTRTTGMPRATTEPHPVPIFSPTLSMCAICGAFLTPDEHEVHLRVTSALLATRWPLPIRLLCRRCVRHEPQAAPETDEPHAPGTPA